VVHEKERLSSYLEGDAADEISLRRCTSQHQRNHDEHHHLHCHGKSVSEPHDSPTSVTLLG
jgi:hypothetical protein